eukprot:SAG11_NODE_3364_length_2497_cov_2.449124_3_plen_44_part_00
MSGNMQGWDNAGTAARDPAPMGEDNPMFEGLSKNERYFVLDLI